MERETLLLARSGALLTPALRHFHLLSPNFSDLNQSFMQIKKETHSAVTSVPDNDRRCFWRSPSGSWCCLTFWTQPIFERNRGHPLTGSKRIRAEISDTDLKDDKLGGNVVADKGRRGAGWKQIPQLVEFMEYSVSTSVPDVKSWSFSKQTKQR